MLFGFVCFCWFVHYFCFFLFIVSGSHLRFVDLFIVVSVCRLGTQNKRLPSCSVWISVGKINSGKYAQQHLGGRITPKPRVGPYCPLFVKCTNTNKNPFRFYVIVCLFVWWFALENKTFNSVCLCSCVRLLKRNEDRRGTRSKQARRGCPLRLYSYIIIICSAVKPLRRS